MRPGAELLRCRIDAMWLAADPVDPVDMRAGANRLIARAVQVFGAAQAHHSCPLSPTRLAVPSVSHARDDFLL